MVHPQLTISNQVCATRLSTRFPDSPRVAVLLGTIMEGKGMLGEAKLFYESILADNESDVVRIRIVTARSPTADPCATQAIRKRLIALHLHAPLLSSSSAVATTSKSKAVASASAPSTPSGESPLSKEKGIELLVEYLDTVYNDAEGWAELASVYASLRLSVLRPIPCPVPHADRPARVPRYPQSLAALSHLILLAPHNPYHLLRHAETAYTIGDFPLAYKELLRVVEMSNGVAGTGGVGRRAAMGVKLVRRFAFPPSAVGRNAELTRLPWDSASPASREKAPRPSRTRCSSRARSTTSTSSSQNSCWTRMRAHQAPSGSTSCASGSEAPRRRGRERMCGCHVPGRLPPSSMGERTLTKVL